MQNNSSIVIPPVDEAMSQKNTSDRDLWLSFKSGDIKALEILYHNYYNQLVNYGIKLLNDSSQAEDCLQDLFLKLWNRRNRLDDVFHVKAYLYKSYRHSIMSSIDEKKRRDKKMRLSTNNETEITFSIEEMIIENENEVYINQRLIDALSRLSPRQKEIIYLRFYKNLSYEEIETVLGLNYQSLRNLLHKALSSIKEKLAVLILAIVLTS